MQRFIYGEPYIDVLLKRRMQHNLQGGREIPGCGKIVFLLMKTGEKK